MFIYFFILAAQLLFVFFVLREEFAFLFQTFSRSDPPGKAPLTRGRYVKKEKKEETERPPTGQIALARAATPACSGAPLGPRHVSSGTSDEAFGGGGGTDHPPPWPGVARHPVRF